LLVLSILIVPFGGGGSVLAGEVDILIEKLVEKGVLSPSDAKDLVKEIQKESAREKEAVKKVAAETAKEVAKKEGGFELPKWVKIIKPFGDLRLRHDTQWRTTTSGDTTRNRERLRLRFGFKIPTSETSEVGIRLVSGSGFQNTTNQSFDEHGRGKNIFIDRAYAKWKPSDNFTLLGGKHKNHMFTTPLIWDPDVNPEGLAETINFGISNKVKLFANFGQWIIAEQSSTSDDPTLLAFQLGTEIKPGNKMKLVCGVSYYDYLKMDRLKYNSDDITDNETFIGYNNRHGQQMVFDDKGRLLNEWGCFELVAKFNAKELLPTPFSVFGSYVINLDADIDDYTSQGVALAGTDPSDLLAYGSDDRDTGWLVGFDLGRKKKKGDLYFKYHYQVLEDYAFPAVFVDSDMHNGGTNNKGHKAGLRYYIRDNIQARATAYFTERDDERKDGQFDEDRIQLDVVLAFP